MVTHTEDGLTLFMMKTLKTGNSERTLLGIRRKSLGCKIGLVAPS
jgi:hypothetical protein